MAGNINNTDENELHSAIATWSGFVYQGKIALYHVIKLLINDTNSSIYKLQLDSLDDFAIIDDNGDILSLHQVKAEKSNLYSNYVGAFNKLEERLEDYSAHAAFFHLAAENQKSFDDIKASHPKFDIYKYKNENYYCALDEIDDFIEDLICDYHSSICREELNGNDNVVAIRCYLEEMILKQVIGIHSQNHKGLMTIREGAFNLTISFADFKSVLERDIIDWLSNEDYFIHLFRSSMNEFYQEYLIELVEDGIVLDTEVQGRLSRYLIHISKMESKALLKFLRSILPHRKFKLNSILDYGNVAPKEEELKDAFFLILKDISKDANLDGCSLSWQCDDSKTYVPSAIDSSNKSRISRQIIKNITNTDIEVAFEEQKIITKCLDVPSILTESNLIKEVEDEREKNRITQWTKTSLVMLKDVKKIIKQ